MSQYVVAAQTIGIASAFGAAGGMTALSVFDVPIFKALPASHSLPQIRWMFSRGSHVYPTAGFLSALSFAYLAYDFLPGSSDSVADLLRSLTSGGKSTAYLTAALLCIGIGPATQVMVPTNFKLMDINADKGGNYSSKSAKVAQKKGSAAAADTPDSARNTNELTDRSGPQSKTREESTPEEDREVRELLTKFGLLNYIRAALMTGGGAIALLAALTP